MKIARFWLLVLIPSILGCVAVSAKTVRIEVPEDLGPSTIDVSSYPQEYQETYKDILIPVFKFLGHPARIVNSPVIEMDAHLEASERKLHPDLFSDPQIALATRDGWKNWVKKIYQRPACCSLCLHLTRQQARRLWDFMVFDSLQRKTGANAQAWIRLRRDIIGRYHQQQHSQLASHQIDEKTDVPRRTGS